MNDIELQIEELRETLNELLVTKDNLIEDELILKVSMELDELINISINKEKHEK